MSNARVAQTLPKNGHLLAGDRRCLPLGIVAREKLHAVATGTGRALDGPVIPARNRHVCTENRHLPANDTREDFMIRSNSLQGNFFGRRGVKRLASTGTIDLCKTKRYQRGPKPGNLVCLQFAKLNKPTEKRSSFPPDAIGQEVGQPEPVAFTVGSNRAARRTARACCDVKVSNGVGDQRRGDGRFARRPAARRTLAKCTRPRLI